MGRLKAFRWLLLLVLLLANLPAFRTDDFYDDYSDAAAGANTKSAPVQITYGVISCVSVAVLIIMLYMGVFGRRMRSTAQRWHVINCCIWGILHLISYASFADKAPWPNYITNKDWKKTSLQVEALTSSVFPAGMVFVFLEAIILTLVPQLSNSIIFNLIFFFLLVPFLNAFVIFCYYAHYMKMTWYYEPIYMFNIGSYAAFCGLLLVYIIFCFIGMCMCCKTIRSSKKSYRNMGTYADMWMLIPYALVPAIMYGPSFGITTTNFVLTKLLDWIIKSGMLNSAGDPNGFMSKIDMDLVTQMMTNALLAMPWFLLLFPIAQAGLAFVCLRMWREQLFFSLSCGRWFSGMREKIVAYTWDDVTATAPPTEVKSA